MLSVGVIPSFSSRAMIDKLMRYPYRCLEQTTSRGMGFLFGMGEYPAAGSADSFPEDLSKEIKKAIRDNGLQTIGDINHLEELVNYINQRLERRNNPTYRKRLFKLINPALNTMMIFLNLDGHLIQSMIYKL